MAYTYGRQIGADLNDFKRSLGALVGIAQGLVSDQQLTDKKIHFLHDWLTENEAISTRWPGDVIYTRVRAVLADGSITADERQYLIDTLLKLVGSDGPDLPKATHATALAHDVVECFTFVGKSFCFTGDFIYGPRKSCESAIKKRGGFATGSVGQTLDYLVIGSLGSVEWKHGSFGTKVEKAMKYKRSGLPILVVQEECWARSLGQANTVREDQMVNEASADLLEALQSQVETLEALGWGVALSAKTVDLYDHFKNGKIKKSPSVGVMFCEQREELSELSDPAEGVFYAPQGPILRPWHVFSPGGGTSYKDVNQAVKLFLIHANKHAPRGTGPSAKL